MAKKITNCEMCGRRMNLQMNNGKMVCSTCTVVRGACKHRRGSVLKNIIEFSGCSESQQQDVEEIYSLVDEIVALDAELNRLKKELAA